MRFRAAWFLPGLLGSALASLIVGAFAGVAMGWAVLSVCLLALLLSQYSDLLVLYRWVSQSRLTDPPERAGLWGEVFNHLHRHRRANLRRRRELARLIVRSRRAVEALPYGVALLDAENRLEWCNETAHQHFGIDAVSDRGQSIQNFVRHPEFVEYLESGEYGARITLRVGAAAEHNLAVQLVVVDDGARMLLSNDVTGAVRLETMRRDFVANASHELRTPLTVLSGFLETIRDLNLDASRVRDYVGLMAPQAERMKRIIDDLLTLSSIEHAPAPAPERVPVRALLERVLGEARVLSGGRHQIALQCEGEHDLTGSETEITSAFLNLVTNAIRYTPEGGRISIAWRSTDAGASFSVDDTGIGIPAEHIPRLTERFYRVDRSRSRETGGTGLGLAIVKHALARHNAVLEIRSEPGKGSVFSVRFPASRLMPRPSEERIAG